MSRVAAIAATRQPRHRVATALLSTIGGMSQTLDAQPTDQTSHPTGTTDPGLRARARSLRTLAAVAITTVALSGAAGAGLAAASSGSSGGRAGFGGPPGMGRPGQLGGQAPGGQAVGGQAAGGQLTGLRTPGRHRRLPAAVPGELPAATAPSTRDD